MVMETPSPQCVGREFVRQYYTLLNKAPLHLHRFYSNNSSFLHGGLDRPGQETKPVVGQQEIHQKIMQLNFRDCHAKILQVDAHETLESAVVVQVIGELSNNGLPMRRFMQTFVLAPQSPKKYYVRNDIFRYQDEEVFTEDDETENNALTEVDTEEQQTNLKNSTDPLHEDDGIGYYEPEIMRNGSVHVSETVSKFAPPPPPPPPPQQPAPPREIEPSPQPELEVESTKSDWEEEDVDEVEEEEEERGHTSDRGAEDSPAPETSEHSQPVTQEPKTYANMVSKNTPTGNASSAPVVGSSTTSPVSSQPPAHKPEPPASFHKPEGLTSTTHQATTPQSNFGGPPHRLSRPRVNSGRGGGRFDVGRDLPSRSPEDFDPEKRKPAFVHYPDSQQLFVGNLTHSITEEDLKQYFQQYGNVLDMRINTKQNQKVGGGKVPNFGFIVFEDPDSVQKVLSVKPIYFNEHRLNVEEKKRPKDNRIPIGDNRMGPARGGISSRVGLGGRGGRGGMVGSQGAGRGDNRGGVRGGSYVPRR